MLHFYLDLPEHVTSLTDRDAVEAYAARAGAPAGAVQGLTPDQLLSFPVPGTWSIQQIIAHLVDSDAIASYRMKRVIAEEDPVLDLYDESAFAERLFYDRLDIGSLCTIFRLNRQLTADLLRQLAPEAFMRAAQHPEVGPLTLATLVRTYVHHVDHHLEFVRRKREMVS